MFCGVKLDWKVLCFLDKHALQQPALSVIDNALNLNIFNKMASDGVAWVAIISTAIGLPKAFFGEDVGLEMDLLGKTITTDLRKNFVPSRCVWGLVVVEHALLDVLACFTKFNKEGTWRARTDISASLLPPRTYAHRDRSSHLARWQILHWKHTPLTFLHSKESLSPTAQHDEGASYLTVTQNALSQTLFSS